MKYRKNVTHALTLLKIQKGAACINKSSFHSSQNSIQPIPTPRKYSIPARITAQKEPIHYRKSFRSPQNPLIHCPFENSQSREQSPACAHAPIPTTTRTLAHPKSAASRSYGFTTRRLVQQEKIFFFFFSHHPPAPARPPREIQLACGVGGGKVRAVCARARGRD